MTIDNSTLIPAKTKIKAVGPSTIGPSKTKYVFIATVIASVSLIRVLEYLIQSQSASCSNFSYKYGCVRQDDNSKVSEGRSFVEIEHEFVKYIPPSSFPIFVISPTSAAFRRHHVANQLQQQDVDFQFQTTDSSIKHMNGKMGTFCGHSKFQKTVNWETLECTTHLRLMHRMVADNVDLQLVLADDIVFNKKQGRFLDTLQSSLHELPSNWGLLWLHRDMNTSAWLDQNGVAKSCKMIIEDGSLTPQQEQPFAIASRMYTTLQTPKLYEIKGGDTSLRAIMYTRDFAQKVLATVYSSSHETSISYFSSFITEVASSSHSQFPRAYAAIPNLLDVQAVFPLSLQQKEQMLAAESFDHKAQEEAEEEEEGGGNVEQQNITREEIRSKNNKKKKHVILAATGDVSQIPNWMKGYEEEANWDIIAIYYGDNPYYNCPQCIAVQRKRGAKFNLVYQFLQTSLWKELRGQYSTIMIADDDLVMDVHSLNIAFTIFNKYNLTLGQQSVCGIKNSYTLWNHIYQNREKLLRYTSLVEIMAPIFKADFFNKEVNYTLAEAWTGFGLDSAWPVLLGHPKNKIAVIDAVCMAHSKEPLLAMQGRKKIYSDNILPFGELEEEKRVFARFSIDKDFLFDIKQYSSISMVDFLAPLDFKERMYYLTHRLPADFELLNETVPSDGENMSPKKRSDKGVGIITGMMALGVAFVFVVLQPKWMAKYRVFKTLSRSSRELKTAGGKGGLCYHAIPQVVSVSGIKTMWDSSPHK